MGEFYSNDHYIYYCGEEVFRRNGVAHIVNKRVWNAVLGCNLKNNRVILVHFQGKSFNITVIQIYVLTTNAEEAEVEHFYEDLQDLIKRKKPPPKKKKIFSIIGDWNAKVRSQEIPGVTGKFLALEYKNKAGQRLTRVLPREATSHSKYPLPATEEMTLHMDITRWSIPKSDWLYSLEPKMEKRYTVSKNKNGSWL